MSYTATSDLGYFPVTILAWQCQRKEQTVHQEALWWCSKGVATDLHEGFDLGLVASGQVSLGGENGCFRCFQVSQSTPLFGGTDSEVSHQAIVCCLEQWTSPLSPRASTVTSTVCPCVPRLWYGGLFRFYFLLVRQYLFRIKLKDKTREAFLAIPWPYSWKC